jgi:hypothetical protein
MPSNYIFEINAQDMEPSQQVVFLAGLSNDPMAETTQPKDRFWPMSLLKDRLQPGGVAKPTEHNYNLETTLCEHFVEMLAA